MNLISRLGRRFRLQDLSQAYRMVFCDEVPAREVLADLDSFCYGHEGTFHENDREAARRQGRQEVWHRIMNHLHLSDEKLMALYQNRPINFEE